LSKDRHHTAVSSSARERSQIHSAYSRTLAGKSRFVPHASVWECRLQMADVTLIFHFVREAWWPLQLDSNSLLLSHLSSDVERKQIR